MDGASEHPAGNSPTKIARGGHVILRDFEGSKKIFMIGESCKDLRMGRYSLIPLESILGQPYGSLLRRSETGQWLRHRREADSGAEAECTEDVDHCSNQHFAQNNTAQSLSPSEVQKLKRSCGGEGVVEALANNSATFATKTKFAQDKYIKKKQAKHVQQVALLRPTLMELCETYMQQNRNKICGLRFDYVSSILSQADVRTGGRYLLFDAACGLVAAGMAERMHGSGRIFRIFRKSCPDKALNELDLGDRRRVVRPLHLDMLQSADPLSHQWLQEQSAPDAAADASANGDENDESGRAATRAAARVERTRQRREDALDFQSGSIDAVIVVAGDEEAALAAEISDLCKTLLSPGGRLVFFGQHMQPLAAHQGSMRSSGDFVDVTLHQLFTREFQVLPQRTHPIMTATAMLCEGFVLCASKLASEAGKQSAKRQRCS